MKATVWSKDNCPFCVEAKKILINKGYEVDERIIGFNATKEDLIKVVPHARSVPQIFIEDQYIGDCNQLKEHFAKNVVKSGVQLQWDISFPHD